MVTSFLALFLSQFASVPNDVGPLVRALWLMQSYGVPAAATPKNDVSLKSLLVKALASDGILQLSELGGLMHPDTFKKLAGSDGKIDAEEVAGALASAVPASRNKLNRQLSAHAEFLTTSFDMIDELHRETGTKLSKWIADNFKVDEQLHLTVVCTGNSRRSMMGSSMGNLAAAYYGMPNIQFHSGGTAPSAFNQRTVKTLREIGFAIEPTGREAERGHSITPNPIYRVAWGEGLEILEFSKHYADDSNPHFGFAALMVCNEADSECPNVRGSALRLSLPYLDPKIYDDGSFEDAKYAERRDDIGRFMLSTMAQARREIESRKPAR